MFLIDFIIGEYDFARYQAVNLEDAAAYLKTLSEAKADLRYFRLEVVDNLPDKEKAAETAAAPA
jgi:hypothetical protein